MLDKLEFVARILRYPFVVAVPVVFIASNLQAYLGNDLRMWMFVVLGGIWWLATVYIDIRETRRTRGRAFAGNVAETVDLGRSGRRRQGLSRIMMSPYKWLRKYSAVVGVLAVAGGAIALYVVPSRPWWGVVLVLLGPVAMLWMRHVERKGRGNESLIRQLQSLVENAKALEYSIRNCTRAFLGKSQVQSELGVLGVQGVVVLFRENWGRAARHS